VRRLHQSVCTPALPPHSVYCRRREPKMLKWGPPRGSPLHASRARDWLTRGAKQPPHERYRGLSSRPGCSRAPPQRREHGAGEGLCPLMRARGGFLLQQVSLSCVRGGIEIAADRDKREWIGTLLTRLKYGRPTLPLQDHSVTASSNSQLSLDPLRAVLLHASGILQPTHAFTEGPRSSSARSTQRSEEAAMLSKCAVRQAR
jgi:hypothetical protein